MNLTNFAPFAMNVTILGITLNLTGIVMQLIASVVILFIAKVAISLIPAALKGMDDWVDVFKKIDFSQRMHKATAKAISYLTFLFAIAYIFVVWNIENPLENALFQIIALFILAKMIIVMIYPSLKGLDERMKTHRISRHTRKITEKLSTYTVWTLFIIGVIYVLGFTDVLTAAIAGAGVLGIVIGFAAKDMVSNIFGGAAIILDKPFVIGDTIEVKGIAGTVEEIALRSTTVKMFDNKVVTIPNSLLSTNPIINYTRKKIRRIEIPVGISYDSDIEEVIRVIKKSLSKIDGVITDKKMVEVIVSGFGDFSINLSVRAWVETSKGILTMKTKCAEEIKKTFDKHGIEIPYPVRVMKQSREKPTKRRK